MILDSGWSEQGGIKSMTFQGSCGEAFVGSQRLVPARSPNLPDINATVNLAHPPYNVIKDLLVETGTRGVMILSLDPDTESNFQLFGGVRIWIRVH